MTAGMSVEVLNGFIKNIRKYDGIFLYKPERVSLMDLQKKVYNCVKDSTDKELLAKHKEFVKICDRAIYRKNKK